METALYCPEVGYYERGHASVGQRGDFCTSVSVGPVFGRLLAADFAGKLRSLGLKRPQIVETGAHDGQLAADILTALHHADPELGKQVEYWIIEPSARRRQWQEEKLAMFAGRVRWAENLRRVNGGVTGVCFSNELLDAFPVRRLGWDAGARRWFEWGVDWNGARFVWTRLSVDMREDFPYANAALDVNAEQRLQLEGMLPDGFVIELNPRAAAWWREAAESLQTGWLVAFDYGLPAEELLRPERTQGTLRAYCGQRLGDDLLAEPGRQDLTAHVNFTTIERAGIGCGLRTEFFDSQERYLSAVLSETLRLKPTVAWSPEELRQVQTLIHPAHFGRMFRVLSQSRNSRRQTDAPFIE